MKIKCFNNHLLRGRVAIVTGSASGIGRAIAMAISEVGGKVVVLDREIEKAEKVVSEIRKSGGEAIALRVDVSNSTEVQESIKMVIAEFGTIDILVNNAGVIRNKAFFEISERDWDEILDINLKGAFLCSFFAGKVMASKKSGSIINVTSVEAEKYLPKSCHYAVSKAGLKMLTKAMAVDLAEYGIRVNSIAPGVIATGLTKNLLADEKRREKYTKIIPLKRIGDPADIPGAVIFLASDCANYITGADIYVDGGIACI